MSGLEFEQKFVLDNRKAEEIMRLLVDRAVAGDPHSILHIRQFYDKNGDRYRATSTTAGYQKYVRETKKSIKIGTPYSICVETEEDVTREVFEIGWEKNKSRRLQKERFTLPGKYNNHNVIVDFFFTREHKVDTNVYAIIAEDETMMNPETIDLYLRFGLPIYLEGYILKTVDDSDSTNKVFKSANMVDTPEGIGAVTKAIEKLYGPL
jgi:hypothetical protein